MLSGPSCSFPAGRRVHIFRLVTPHVNPPCHLNQTTTLGGAATTLNKKQLDLCESSKWDFSDLRALFLNCTLKRTPEQSHTEGLTAISKSIMEADAGWIGEAGPGPSYLDEGSGGAGEPLYQPPCNFHDVEPPPPRANDQGRRWHSCPRQPAIEMGCRLSFRSSESGISVGDCRGELARVGLLWCVGANKNHTGYGREPRRLCGHPK
jgi:hypothetical protein